MGKDYIVIYGMKLCHGLFSNITNHLIMSGLNIAMTAPPAEYEMWDAQEGGYCQTEGGY